ncbi:hypothetical protein BCR43DRAFT_134219 [Syncephalastrum racemosum]|uniref:Uncharacterized protein n=1 Tax=Syncephalastrum racemosum TaxID=13706 RepID=A0A1X2HLJ3_SYNRA|nr:hypothetical protein BCR43DRAFT_134219 [Syncephalastrum racemosum]
MRCLVSCRLLSFHSRNAIFRTYCQQFSPTHSLFTIRKKKAETRRLKETSRRFHLKRDLLASKREKDFSSTMETSLHHSLLCFIISFTNYGGVREPNAETKAARRPQSSQRELITQGRWIDLR